MILQYITSLTFVLSQIETMVMFQTAMVLVQQIVQTIVVLPVKENAKQHVQEVVEVIVQAVAAVPVLQLVQVSVKEHAQVAVQQLVRVGVKVAVVEVAQDVQTSARIVVNMVA